MRKSNTTKSVANGKSNGKIEVRTRTKFTKRNKVVKTRTRTPIDPKSKIVSISKDNPYREDSRRFKAYLRLRKGAAVASYATNREMRRILNRSIRKGAVKVS